MKLLALFVAGALTIGTAANAQFSGGDFRFHPRGYHYHPGHNAGHYAQYYQHRHVRVRHHRR